MRLIVSNAATHPAPQWAAKGAADAGYGVEYFTAAGLARPPSGLSVFARHLGRRVVAGGGLNGRVRSVAPLTDGLRLLARNRGATRLELSCLDREIRQVEHAAARRLSHLGPLDTRVLITGSLNAHLADYCARRGIAFATYLPQPFLSSGFRFDDHFSGFLEARERVNGAEVLGADLLLCSSELVAESVRAAGALGRVVVIPPGYGDFEPSGVPTSAAAGSRGRAEFVYVGRMAPQKNFPVLLSALSLLPEGAAQLTVVTPDVPEASRLVAESNVSRHISIRPSMPRSDLLALFRSMTALVLPSEFEGYGLVIVEALASGLPVITTQFTAGGDLGIDGVAGLVVPAGDSDALATALSDVCRNPDTWSGYRLSAARLARQVSWGSYVDRVQPIFREWASAPFRARHGHS